MGRSLRGVRYGVAGLLALLVLLWAAASEAAIQLDHVLGEPGEGVAPGAEADWQPLAVGRSLGFVTQPVWLRLQIDHQALADELHYLVIQPGHLDDVRVHAMGGDQALLLRAGDRWPATETAVRHGYSLLLAEAQLRDGVLVRLQSVNVMQPRVMLLTPAELQQENLRFHVFFGIAFSATLFYLLWAVAAAATLPSPLLLAWVLRLALYLLTVFVHLGLLRGLLDGETLPSQDLVHNLTALGYISVAQLFDYLLLRELGLRRARWVFLGTVLGFLLLKAGAFVLGEVSLALLLNNLSVLVTLALALALVPLAPARSRSPYPLRRGAVAVYFLLQVLPVLAILRAEALHSAGYGSLLELGFISYSIVPAGYITYLLFLRQQALAQERAALAEQARKQGLLARAEQGKRRELGDLMDMLVHEIRTPLATLRMARRLNELSPELVERAVRGIDHVLVQACRADDIERGAVAPRADAVDVAALLAPLARDCGLALPIHGQAPKALADPALLGVVLVNLLGNAAKYRVPGTPVSAALAWDAEHVTLRICNRIEAGQAPEPARAFDKYYRHARVSGQPGTGLGLHIVSRLCERMQVAVDMLLEGEQLVMRLRLPRAMEAGGVSPR